MEIMKITKRNEDFALFYYPGDEPFWRAEAVNPSQSVGLGGIKGEYRAEGGTAIAALTKLVQLLESDYGG